MKRRTPLLATAAAVLISLVGLTPANATVPDVTALSASPQTIYPLANTAKHPGSTTISITGDASTVTDLEIRDATDMTVRDIATGGAASATWDGRDSGDIVVPAGSYTVHALNSGTTPATDPTATIVVSGAKLVLKTYTRTVTAAGSTIEKFVGKCSTLRKPSKRGWKGSLGYYGNTKCGGTTFNKAAVFTVNAITVPAADRYADVRVNLFGGAAKAARKSRGIEFYFNSAESNAVGILKVTKTLGNHTGRTVGAADLINSHRRFVWAFETAGPKQKYDVKNFTVVLRYYVLG